MGQNSGAFEIDEWDVSAHAFGNARQEGGNLFVDVHKESVGGPATLFADGVAIFSVEFHCHGATRSQGVAADEIRGETAEVQFEGTGGCLYRGVDVGGEDVSGTAFGEACRKGGCRGQWCGRGCGTPDGRGISRGSAWCRWRRYGHGFNGGRVIGGVVVD
jgi:hypothetical protein